MLNHGLRRHRDAVRIPRKTLGWHISKMRLISVLRRSSLNATARCQISFVRRRCGPSPQLQWRVHGMQLRGSAFRHPFQKQFPMRVRRHFLARRLFVGGLGVHLESNPSAFLYTYTGRQHKTTKLRGRATCFSSGAATPASASASSPSPAPPAPASASSPSPRGTSCWPISSCGSSGICEYTCMYICVNSTSQSPIHTLHTHTHTHTKPPSPCLACCQAHLHCRRLTGHTHVGDLEELPQVSLLAPLLLHRR